MRLSCHESTYSEYISVWLCPNINLVYDSNLWRLYTYFPTSIYFSTSPKYYLHSIIFLVINAYSILWGFLPFEMLNLRYAPIECIQHPGETIFVPGGMWHVVLNIDTTVYLFLATIFSIPLVRLQWPRTLPARPISQLSGTRLSEEDQSYQSKMFMVLVPWKYIFWFVWLEIAMCLCKWLIILKRTISLHITVWISCNR